MAKKSARNIGGVSFDSILNERQHAVVDCMRMKFNDVQSLAYLRRLGFVMSSKTLTKDKKRVEEVKFQRMVNIAQQEFAHQHMDRIDNTELALKLMWQNYHMELDPWKRFQMLKDIIVVQPYLSSYYEATKLVIENRPDLVDNIKNLQSEQKGKDSNIPVLPDKPRDAVGREDQSESDLNRQF
jgi:hypothetical protein